MFPGREVPFFGRDLNGACCIAWPQRKASLFWRYCGNRHAWSPRAALSIPRTIQAAGKRALWATIIRASLNSRRSAAAGRKRSAADDWRPVPLFEVPGERALLPIPHCRASPVMGGPARRRGSFQRMPPAGGDGGTAARARRRRQWRRRRMVCTARSSGCRRRYR